MTTRRIHITGGPGAGKTWLARRLSQRLGLPVYDQDGEALAVLSAMGYSLGDPDLDLEALLAEVQRKMEAFAANEAWISEGSSLFGADVLFERAGTVVMMECSWPVAAYRIPLRHLKAELARNNRFPGWRRLFRFWRYAIRYHRDRNPPGFNEYGVPRNHADFQQYLTAYESKLVFCRGRDDMKALERRLVGA